jgi:DNA-binding SARP family transcriptional activator
MRPVMQLRLASSPRFVHADAKETALIMRDAALLAWLALEGPTSRTRLAALLWPESTPYAGRNALRQRLFQLRKQLGVELVSGSTQLALSAAVVHDLADAATVLGHERCELGPDLDAWLARVRAASAERARQRLLAEAAAAEQVRDWSRALQCGQALLALDPLREDAHRGLMRVYYLAGDRTSALQAFDQCEAVLKDELSTRPSAETLQLLETITRAQSPVEVTGQAVPASVLLPPRMIGRDAELERLHQCWTAGQVVAVIGEAGLGKTRLVQAFAQNQSGLVGAAGRPGDAGVPFATLARLLRAVMSRQSVPLHDVLPASTRNEIARVLPEFDPSAAVGAGEGQRLVMQRALRSLLEAQDDLLGLWVDDLHFADEASLEMLRALIDDATYERGSRAQLRWVLAYRPADAGSPVHALHAALAEQARLTPVVLRPLDERALAALVDSLGLPGISGAALAPGLARRTGGNPLFVLETLKQAWVERKLAQLTDIAQLPRPVSVGHLIELRLAQLSPGALALARVASIAGADFSIAMAEHVLQATAMQFADALHELESAQVMRGSAFAHDLVFDAVRASVPAAIAAHTHERIAVWLEARPAEPARIAQHWIDAGQPHPALPWLQRAADKARAALRYKEHIAFLERKSALQEAAGDIKAAFESLLQAAAAQVDTLRDPAISDAHCERLLQLAATPQQRVRAMVHYANACNEHDAVRAVAAAREGLGQAQALRDEQLTALSHLALGRALTTHGQGGAEAMPHFLACMDWVDLHGSAADRSELHGTLGTLYDNLGRLEEALPHHELGQAFAVQNGDLHHAAIGLSNLACNRLDAGDLTAARNALERSLQLTAQYDDYRANLGLHYTLLVLVDCQDGRFGLALERAELALELMQKHAPARGAEVQLRAADVWAHLGQWARVQAILDLPAVREADRVAVHAATALLRHRLGKARGNAAGDVLTKALQAMPEDFRPDLRLPLLMEHAGTLAPALALAALDAVIGEAAAIQHQGTVLAAHLRAAGIAADVDPERALRHARSALTLVTHRGSTALYPAERWLHPARAMRAAGKVAEAQALLAAGRDWLLGTAAEHVPTAFRDSFLQRNPVNRELLQLSQRLS